MSRGDFVLISDNELSACADSLFRSSAEEQQCNCCSCVVKNGIVGLNHRVDDTHNDIVAAELNAYHISLVNILSVDIVIGNKRLACAFAYKCLQNISGNLALVALLIDSLCNVLSAVSCACDVCSLCGVAFFSAHCCQTLTEYLSVSGLNRICNQILAENKSRVNCCAGCSQAVACGDTVAETNIVIGLCLSFLSGSDYGRNTAEHCNGEHCG